ncbi:unnamed protein product [Dracunculus medinensis]|uniref:Nuclear receptor domain-containing protein n=1 Tax=Dracunculus medinensis TaxID=318479 RepID=A0A0N4U1M9_DRAME|nr:unnamed protein product [Dracunculus medinensis]
MTTRFDFPCASFGTQQSELISTTFNAPTFNAPSIVDTSQHHHSSMHNLSQPSNLLQFHYGNLNENIPSQNHLDQNATRIATGGSFDIVPSNLQTGLTSDEKLCAVCSDRARTVQKKAQYMCTGNKNCTIDKRFRSRCQYCRYQKCLAVGMVKEVVRYGSLSGRRGRLPSKTKLLHSDDPPSPPLPLLTIINRAFADSRSTTASYTFSGLIEDLLEFLEEEFRSFLRFVDKIPRYTDLPRSDILMLTEKNFFALLALKLSNRWTKERKLRLDQVEIDVDSVPEPFKILFSKILQDIPQFRRVIERDSLAFAALLALQLLNAAGL